MKRFLDFIKKCWGGFVDLTRKPVFVLGFPLAVFVLLYLKMTFQEGSHLMLIPILIWIVVMISNSEPNATA